MTISLYSGTPGSGKSMHATKRIQLSLKRGRKPIIANYRINPKAKNVKNFTYIDNFELTPDFLYTFANDYWHNTKYGFREDWILLIIDEAQLLFNSREWNKKNRMDWLQFFSQHRKFGYEIIMIAQFDRMLDRQIRCLIEYEVKHRRLGNFGTKGKIAALFCGGELFVCVTLFYALKEKISVEVMRNSKAVFRLYDSYNAFARDTDGENGAPVGGGGKGDIIGGLVNEVA